MGNLDALYTYRFSDGVNGYAETDDPCDLQRFLDGRWESPSYQRNKSPEAEMRWVAIDQSIRESQERELHRRVKQKTNKIPAVLAPGPDLSTGEYQSLLVYLRRTGYTLHLACRPDYEDVGRSEYRKWTNGEEIPDDLVKIYDKAFSREWFLIFTYSPDVSFPFPIIERGTGGGQGSPCGLHLRGRVEVCYVEVVEQLVRAGL